MIAIAHHQLNGSGDTKDVYHFIDMSVVLIIGLYSCYFRSNRLGYACLKKKESKIDFFLSKSRDKRLIKVPEFIK